MWKSYQKPNKKIKFLHKIIVTILELKETKMIMSIGFYALSLLELRLLRKTKAQRSAYNH